MDLSHRQFAIRTAYISTLMIGDKVSSQSKRTLEPPIGPLLLLLQHTPIRETDILATMTWIRTSQLFRRRRSRTRFFWVRSFRVHTGVTQ
jgi:hypothetical protein